MPRERAQSEPATTRLDHAATEVGSVFVSNYPPYSFWRDELVGEAEAALDRPGRGEVPLGLYLHIPFCRKRCKFCYFRVVTDKSADQIERYVDALGTEVERLARRAAVGDRHLHFLYFGGGTPSYLAVKQLLPLVDRLKAALPWDRAQDIAFEGEPGTLTRSKLEALREIGVTRLSLGIESFDDQILEENGRAHHGEEIARLRPWLAELQFPQLNVDLIAGMVGETWETWRTSVARTIDYDPDSVTIYQMELPFNTIYSKAKLQGEPGLEFADWGVKREWQQYAFEQLAAAGYEPWSAYTMLKRGRRARFVYTEALWRGADMLAAGVSSFGHLSGVHFQNVDRFEDYLGRIEGGQSALKRAFVLDRDQLCTRELVLQLKTGRLDLAYFEGKYGRDVFTLHPDVWQRLAGEGLLEVSPDEVRLLPAGLLRVDQLLPEFYHPAFRGARYT